MQGLINLRNKNKINLLTTGITVTLNIITSTINTAYNKIL